jgi:hypothetical protein
MGVYCVSVLVLYSVYPNRIIYFYFGNINEVFRSGGFASGAKSRI